MSSDPNNLTPVPQPPQSVKVQTGVTETTPELLDKVAGWAARGGDVNFSSLDGLRHTLAEGRERASMFMSILALQRMQRLARLVNLTDKIEERLCSPALIDNLDADQLMFLLRTVESVSKEAVSLINGVQTDAATNAQVLINMVDARQLNVARGDVPKSGSRENVRQAVEALLEKFGGSIRGIQQPVKSEPANGPTDPSGSG